MDWELFTRITREMREAGVEEIGPFYIGESFASPHLLVKAIQWCKRELKFPYVFLTTNGSLASPVWLREVMEAGLDSLKFSINAVDGEQFEKLTSRPAALFWKALTNLKVARPIRNELKSPCGIYASSIRYSQEQHERMSKMAEASITPYVDEWYELPLYQMGIKATETRDRLGFERTHGNPGRIDPSTGLPNRKSIPCWSVFCEGHVRVDGHLSACCFGADDRFDVGDLNIVSFMDAWNGSAFQQIRAAHLRADIEGLSVLENTMCEVCAA
jgi:MoaA/NifB/PqqE/SkfB family radical SAM enzyme